MHMFYIGDFLGIDRLMEDSIWFVEMVSLYKTGEATRKTAGC